MSESAQWQVLSGHDVKVFSGDIAKSQNDDRQYRIIKLPNNLEAILVHDPKTDKAAAALDVATGHLSDPDDMPGLAHFCEHLLFMGTKQYPKENEYGEYINTHGGQTNAYTSASNTNYHFSVAPTHLEGALSRFAGFFHSPLFLPSGTLRELNAVDSEHKKNNQQDSWRLFQLGKGLSEEGHPWRKFGSGNRETLLAAGRQVAAEQRKQAKYNGSNGALPTSTPEPSIPSTPAETEPDGGPAGRETRRRLIEWWENEYCAGRMKLAVLGRDSLDEMTTMVSTLFAPILNRGAEPLTMIETPPLGSTHQGTIVFAKTIMDMNLLEVAFGIPYQQSKYETKPADFLSHMIGHEGPGSLHSYLKHKGLILSLETGRSSLGRGFDAFRVTLMLTPEGIANWREILVALYKYISMLKASSIQPYHYQEIKQLADIRFRFREKRRPDQYVTLLAELLQKTYPRERLLSGSTLVWSWHESEVRELLDMLNVKTGRVMLMCKDPSKVAGSDTWLKEKWYGTEYQMRKLDADLVARASAPNDLKDLHLPQQNPFVPSNVVVKGSLMSEPAKRPLKIRDTALTTLWFKQDDQFIVPKGNIMIDIKSPLVNVSPINTVLCRLSTELVMDHLTEYAYSAQLAGLQYSLSPYTDGIRVFCTGYDDKIAILLEKVLSTMKTFQPDSARVQILKAQLKLDYQNFKLEQPYKAADYWARYILHNKRWTIEDLLAEVDSVQPDTLQAFLLSLLSRSYIEMLVQGNFSKEQAIEMLGQTEHILSPAPLAKEERPTERSLVLPKSSNNIWLMDVPNRDEVNSSICYYCHVGDVTDNELRAKLSLFAHIAHEPCFDQLRTKEQLGYLVFSTTWSSTGSMGWRILIQSEQEPQYLESRIDAFLSSLQLKLESMPEEEFAHQKQGLITLKQEKPKNLNEEMSLFWSHISSGYHDFLRRETDIKNLNTVTLKDILNFFKVYVSPTSSTRRKLSVHCKSQLPANLKFTVEAAEAFCIDLRDAGVEVDEQQFLALAAKEPPADAVRNHWKKALAQDAKLTEVVKDALLLMLEKHALQFAPHTVMSHAEIVNTAIPPSFVVDVVDFKHTLTLSPAAVPVEEYQDIPLSPRL